MISKVVSLEYSSFYIAGSIDVQIPIGGDPKTIRASEDCLNVACLMWQDGGTEVSLGFFDEFGFEAEPLFDGRIKTKGGKVILFDANDPEIATLDVSSSKTRIRVWANRPVEPDEVFVAVG